MRLRGALLDCSRTRPSLNMPVAIKFMLRHITSLFKPVTYLAIYDTQICSYRNGIILRYKWLNVVQVQCVLACYRTETRKVSLIVKCCTIYKMRTIGHALEHPEEIYQELVGQ